MSSHATRRAVEQGAPVRPGDPAPDFTLPDQNGRPFALRSLRGRTVVLYFYPRDHTMLCTAQACEFRDNSELFAQADAEIVGISSDPPVSHQGFAAQHGLPFLLLSDVDGRVREQYGVPRLLGLLPGRVTYVIDADGIVRDVIQSSFSVGAHVHGALRRAEALRAAGRADNRATGDNDARSGRSSAGGGPPDDTTG